jgi:hypothetical protein
MFFLTTGWLSIRSCHGDRLLCCMKCTDKRRGPRQGVGAELLKWFCQFGRMLGLEWFPQWLVPVCLLPKQNPEPSACAG